MICFARFLFSDIFGRCFLRTKSWTIRNERNVSGIMFGKRFRSFKCGAGFCPSTVLSIERFGWIFFQKGFGRELIFRDSLVEISPQFFLKNISLRSFLGRFFVGSWVHKIYGALGS